LNVGTRLTAQGAFAHITTLEQVVASYRERFDFSSQGGHHDPVLAWCKKAFTLESAIVRACSGRREDGKMFSKGSCVKTSSRGELATELLIRQEALEEVPDFEGVYDVVDGCGVKGIGRMMKYNVSERVGAYLKIYPQNFVYLHAGPLKGYRRLTGHRGEVHRVPKSSLPREFQELSIHDIEDCLCEYRDVLRREMWNG